MVTGAVVPGVSFGLQTGNSPYRGGKHRVKTRRSAIRCGDLTASRTDSDPAGFDKPGFDEYNPLYIKTTRRWWRLSPTDIYPSCCAQRINAYTVDGGEHQLDRTSLRAGDDIYSTRIV